ncbi:MAG: cation:proton antiporter [Dehalococcoidia bacterium]|jgi:Kef-type K+ transport system membrane component KefB|nr:cation:proton antiporter [Dehalococcoidia bacterium]HJN58778.1 cation:proton antiporter [Dehalococcoidia bacterium]
MHDSPLHLVANIILSLSIILICAKLGGEFFERILKMPPVLGELIAGIIIGPFALGGIIIGGFGPLFKIPLDSHTGNDSIIPVDYSLYFLAQLGAVILLFEAGLETNKKQFLKYLKPASAVAIGGVVLPFVLGVFATVLTGFASFNSLMELLPALFIGSIMTATSVGITARVLGDMGKLDSEEGVTILAGAVVDDVLGILILAIIVAIETTGVVSVGGTTLIAVKAISFWFVLTFLGGLVAPWISNFFNKFKGAGVRVCLSLSLAFVAAGVAELYFGLAMIIGSYSLGLAMSPTQIKEEIEESLQKINFFLVPVFFCVIGMQVDLGAIFAGNASLFLTISFVVILTLFAIFSKFIGCGIPALLFGFNRLGAWRIAVGMLPRGEVALIIAGIGLVSGVIDNQVFGVAVIMTIITTVIAPILLSPAFKSGKSGLR